MLACPLGIDTGKLVKELRAREHTAARGARRAARRRGAGPRSSAARARRCASEAPRARRDARCCGRRSATSWCPPGRPRHAAPGAAPLPGDRARGRGGRLPAGLRQPHLRPRARRRADRQPAGGAGRGLGARRAPGLDTAGRGRPLLRDALELEGLPRRATRTWPQVARTGPVALDGRGEPAGRDRRQLVRPRADRGRREGDRGARLGRVGARPPAAGADGAQPAAQRPRCTRPARPATWA